LPKQCNSPIEKAAGQIHSPGFAKTVALINWDKILFSLLLFKAKKKNTHFFDKGLNSQSYIF
jgi:hypothetical protein